MRPATTKLERVLDCLRAAAPGAVSGDYLRAVVWPEGITKGGFGFAMHTLRQRHAIVAHGSKHTRMLYSLVEERRP